MSEKEFKPTPFKEKDFKPCAYCGKGVLIGSLTFYRVKIEQQFVANPRNINRQLGLGQFLGSPGLASVMGDDADMAAGMGEHSGLICLNCVSGAYDGCAPIVEILEQIIKQKEEKP